jgi:glycosyltransferase involved in cell wall biosynthesis
MDLSIAIVNWNTQLLLKQCIESIRKTTKEITYEIIVVDNNSKDGSQEMLSSEYRCAHRYNS